MFILFKNKFNILNLKQNFYFFIAKDCKIINEILNFLLKQNRIQKVFLKISFAVTFPIFVI